MKKMKSDGDSQEPCYVAEKRCVAMAVMNLLRRGLVAQMAESLCDGDMSELRSVLERAGPQVLVFDSGGGMRWVASDSKKGRKAPADMLKMVMDPEVLARMMDGSEIVAVGILVALPSDGVVALAMTQGCALKSSMGVSHDGRAVWGDLAHCTISDADDSPEMLDFKKYNLPIIDED